MTRALRFSSGLALVVALLPASVRAEDKAKDAGPGLFSTNGSIGVPGAGSLAGLGFSQELAFSPIVRYAFQADYSQLLVIAENAQTYAWSASSQSAADGTTTQVLELDRLSRNSVGVRGVWGIRAWNPSRRGSALATECQRAEPRLNEDECGHDPDTAVLPGATFSLGGRMFLDAQGQPMGAAGEAIIEYDYGGSSFFASGSGRLMLSEDQTVGMSKITSLTTAETVGAIGITTRKVMMIGSTPANVNLGFIGRYVKQWIKDDSGWSHRADYYGVEAMFALVAKLDKGSLMLTLGGTRPFASDLLDSQGRLSNRDYFVFQIVPGVVF